MKSILMCGLFVMAVAANAAEQPPKTRLESFDDQPGLVIIKGYTTIGKINGTYGGYVEVAAKEFSNQSSGKKDYGISVQVKEDGSLGRENISFVDYDEIDALVRGIDYISKATRSTTKLAEFEAIYKTKGDLEITTFSFDDEVRAVVESGTIGKTSMSMKLASLEGFKKFIVQAKQKLDEVRIVAVPK